MKKLKIYAFIDSQNLNLSVRNDIFRRRKKVYTGRVCPAKRDKKDRHLRGIKAFAGACHRDKSILPKMKQKVNRSEEKVGI